MQTKIDFIYELYSKNSINVENAVKAIWEDIYRFPAYYGLKDLDEDGLTDFSLYFSKFIRKILKSYKPQKASFSTYIYSSIILYKKSWHRLNRKQIKDESVFLQYISNFKEELIISNQSLPYDDFLKKFERLNELKMLENTPIRLSKNAKITIYLLCCQLCTKVDDNLLQKAALLINIEAKQLTFVVDKIRQNLISKYVSERKNVKRNNNAFYYKMKYQEYVHEELKNGKSLLDIEKNNPYMKKLISDYFHNKEIKLIHPTAKEISEITHIPVTSIFYHLSHHNLARLLNELKKKNKSLD